MRVALERAEARRTEAESERGSAAEEQVRAQLLIVEAGRADQVAATANAAAKYEPNPTMRDEAALEGARGDTGLQTRGRQGRLRQRRKTTELAAELRAPRHRPRHGGRPHDRRRQLGDAPVGGGQVIGEQAPTARKSPGSSHCSTSSLGKPGTPLRLSTLLGHVPTVTSTVTRWISCGGSPRAPPLRTRVAVEFLKDPEQRSDAETGGDRVWT